MKEIRQFNRHKEMSSETMSLIGDTITEVKLFPNGMAEGDRRVLINLLSGLYDGYDYTAEIMKLVKLIDVADIDSAVLISGISEILLELETYETI